MEVKGGHLELWGLDRSSAEQGPSLLMKGYHWASLNSWDLWDGDTTRCCWYRRYAEAVWEGRRELESGINCCWPGRDNIAEAMQSRRQASRNDEAASSLPLGCPRQILRGCWLAKEKCNLLNRSVSTRKQRMEDGLRVNNRHKCLLLITSVDSHWFNFPTVPLGTHFLPAQISSCSSGQSQFNTP